MIGTQSGRALRACAMFVLLCGSAVAQPDYDATEVAARRAEFVAEMVAKHGFDREQLNAMLAGAVIDDSILAAISRPAERVVPWHEYRQIFLTSSRIDAGADFWVEHAESIERVARRFGVDPEIIVAIIGVETLFGQRMGRYRVLDALSTLAFAYPPRATFFRSELEQFLLLAREEGVDLSGALGSYAGAMGAGQFIPSSFRAYAVDGDADGHRDLWENWDDILASVANYFSVHGWRAGELVAEEASRTASFEGAEPDNRLELNATVDSLRQAGYEFETSMPESAPAAVFALERDESSFEYWLGFHNFYVITRYNRSFKYALAAYQLSQAIRDKYQSMRGVIQ